MKRRGEKLAILNFGTLMPDAAKVAERPNATLVDMRFVKPLDEALILEMAASHEALVTVEENAIMGGAGSGVNEVLMAHRKPVPVLNIGLPDIDSARNSGRNARRTRPRCRRYGSQNQGLAPDILILICYA
ncbi:transketolase C-terminal domain-containing protein [Escherichia coli]